MAHTPTIEERNTYFNISKRIAPNFLELYVPVLQATACGLLTDDDNAVRQALTHAMCDAMNDVNWCDVAPDVPWNVVHAVGGCLSANMRNAVLGVSRDMREAAEAGLPRSMREAARRICALFPPEELSFVGAVGAGMPMADGNACLTELRRSCSVCGALTMKRCSRCRAAFFCGEACMAAAWAATHRAACRSRRS